MGLFCHGSRGALRQRYVAGPTSSPVHLPDTMKGRIIDKKSVTIMRFDGVDLSMVMPEVVTLSGLILSILVVPTTMETL